MPRSRRPPSTTTDNNSPVDSESAAFRRLDTQDRLTILRAKERHAEMTMAALAGLVGCSKATVYRVLHAADRAELELLIRSSGPHVVDRWLTAIDVAAEKGYHQPARDFLTAGQLIAPPIPPEVQGGRSISVTFAFPLPGVPVVQLPSTGGPIHLAVPLPALDAPPIDAVPVRVQTSDAIPAKR